MKHLRIILITLTLFIIASNSVRSETVSESTNKSFLVPRFSIGFVAGDAGDKILRYDESFKDKLFLNVGLSFEHFIKPNYALGLNLDAAYTHIRKFGAGSTIAYSYSTHFLYKLKTIGKNLPYFRTELGLGFGKIPGTSLDFGTNPLLRFSIGLLHQRTLKSDTRIEIYYRYIKPSDKLNREIPMIDVDNIILLGVEFGFGIAL